MHAFANGFSERLNIEATKHRPPSTTLFVEQIETLCSLAGYALVRNKEKYAANFIIFHPDGKHGLDDGLHVIWHVRAVGFVCLVYYPTLQPYYVRGHKDGVRDEMLDRLASFLPKLGYQNEHVVHLNEEFVIIPDELRYISTGVYVMYATEFQEKYHDLYLFLKEKMVTPR